MWWSLLTHKLTRVITIVLYFALFKNKNFLLNYKLIHDSQLVGFELLNFTLNELYLKNTFISLYEMLFPAIFKIFQSIKTKIISDDDIKNTSCTEHNYHFLLQENKTISTVDITLLYGKFYREHEKIFSLTLNESLLLEQVKRGNVLLREAIVFYA